jgi:hypothetical protein
MEQQRPRLSSQSLRWQPEIKLQIKIMSKRQLVLGDALSKTTTAAMLLNPPHREHKKRCSALHNARGRFGRLPPFNEVLLYSQG